MSAPDLRDELAATISREFLHTWDSDDTPRLLALTDAVLAHPRIARALTVLDLLENCDEDLGLTAEIIEALESAERPAD